MTYTKKTSCSCGWRDPGKNASGFPLKKINQVSTNQRGAQPDQVHCSNPPTGLPKPRDERPAEATLLVPFTPGSLLKSAIQEEDRKYCSMIKSRPVRVMELGGNKLINVLGRNDPWAATRVCDDPACPTCRTRSWLKEERRKAKQDGQKMPPKLLQRTSHQCRREGSNYTVQCVSCLQMGRQTLYRGETSRSSRQRHQEHYRDIEAGLVTSPFVVHSLEEHGGEKPFVAFLIDQVENRPLYRIVRESVKIANMPWGPERLNRCSEWGAPRVPVLSVAGGDGENHTQGEHNPRLEWSRSVLKKIDEGSVKRIRYWQQEDDNTMECETETANVATDDSLGTPPPPPQCPPKTEEEENN